MKFFLSVEGTGRKGRIKKTNKKTISPLSRAQNPEYVSWTLGRVRGQREMENRRDGKKKVKKKQRSRMWRVVERV